MDAFVDQPVVTKCLMVLAIQSHLGYTGIVALLAVTNPFWSTHHHLFKILVKLASLTRTKIPRYEMNHHASLLNSPATVPTLIVKVFKVCKTLRSSGKERIIMLMSPLSAKLLDFQPTLLQDQTSLK